MKWRYRFTLSLFLLSFLAIILRLAHWQIFQAEALTTLGESQYGRSMKLSPPRGEIKTSDDFALAANRITYRVFANPKEISNKEATAQILSPLLGTDVASISSLLALDKFWVSLTTGIADDKKEQIANLKLPGIGFEEQATRYYPEASMAAQLLGFVGKNDLGDNQGYFGVEGYYDRQLRGKEGKAIQIHDALGRPILAKMQEVASEDSGRTLHLHIDRVFQYVVEQELKNGIEVYGAQAGLALAMDPKTGAMLAMASFPTFDPRTYGEFDSSLYKNPIITNTYEPGSTFKPLVMASAIDAGLLTPETRCPICAGPVAIGGYEIRTWNDKYNANETMIDVIKHSDNTGMVFVSQTLGLHKMVSYLHKFGIGETTGIDLQGEVQAPIRDEQDWYPIDLATASFGQGISITPMQLLSGFSALANDGKRMEPHVVSQIEKNTGEMISIAPNELGRPVSSKTAKIITEILVNAVDNGEAKWAKPKGYRIAGKTGTAQIPVAGHYDPNKTIASFIGYAPANDPKFVMLVVVDRPTTSIFGAETAAPIFFNIAKKMLMYYGIAPSQ